MEQDTRTLTLVEFYRARLAVLKQLALPYASHEDYREEWRP